MQTYNSFYNFSKNPFQEGHDQSYIFLSRSFKNASTQINKAISKGNGFTLLIGKPGSGKTSFCHNFILNSGKNLEIGLVSCDNQNSTDLLRSISEALDLQIEITKPGFHYLRKLISNHIINTAKLRKSLVLFIDEAHKLSHENLELLRIFSNIECENNKLIHIVLCGPPQLIDIISKPELRQLKQRISLSLMLPSLPITEIESYIKHRIEVSGGVNHILFDPSAINEIYKYSRGCPRTVNNLCERVIIYCHNNKTRLIKGVHIKKFSIQPQTKKDIFTKLHFKLTNTFFNKNNSGKGLNS